ncbi:hypothetical protein HELRODRAFT_105292 [Helobdella robusta]|uniref:dihydropyrimidinase n=1 Tax=Helobdella robusta TaxID=6412 RepID=T1EDT3_HELRO|nr:hypothetical protein HELRODRAFT_105292 [Helobdella robusta]ESO12354.1 hypothetical protein HELRODRAFT_105292 [Helobdella robusta]
MPGGIDASTHLQQSSATVKSADDFYSGSKAALAGGTTMIFDYVVPELNQSILEAFNKFHEMASEKSCCDFSLHVCLTCWSDKVAQEMEVLVKEKGVNSFHISLAGDAGHIAWNERELYEVLKKCKQLKVLLLVHAENGAIIKEKLKEVISQGVTGPEGHFYSRAEEAEIDAVYRVVSAGNLVNVPVYINNVTSMFSANVISEMRRRGKVVFGETRVSSLVLTGKEYFNESWRHAASHVVSPPFRNDSSIPGYLVNLLANDDLQVVSSDHCTYDVSQRALGKDDFTKIPAGVNGIQERLLVVWRKGVLTGRMDMNKFVAVTSTNAAKIFNLYPRKGRVAVGSDADLVIWDPDLVTTISTKTQQHKGDYNVFEGMEVKGGPSVVISAGSVVLDDDGFRVTQGSGQYVSLPPNCDFIYARISERDKANAPQKVVREPYSGPSFNLSNGIAALEISSSSQQAAHAEKGGEFYNRATSSGGRHQQDSSFHLSGAQIDDSQPVKPSMKVSQPPGGRSSQLW